MPCDQRLTIRTTLKNVDLERMARALDAIGITGAYIFKYGDANQLTARGNGCDITLSHDGLLSVTGYNTARNDEMTRKITQGYSAQVVRDAATRFGFRVSTKTSENNTIQITLSK